MVNITNIDHGQPNWDKALMEDLKKLNNVVLGGRNYFSLTEFKANSYLESYFEMPSVNLKLAANTTYTISTNIPARDDLGAQDLFAGNVGFQAMSNANGVKVGLPLTIVTDDTGMLQVSVRNVSLNNGQYHVQVELGDKATDWRPAVEDIAQVSDTGCIKDGITLLNGTAVFSSFPGDQPSFRIVQMGPLNLMMVCGAVNGLTYGKGGINVSVATFPKQVSDWLATHQTVNTHFFTSSLGINTSWVWRGSTLELQISSDTILADTWVNFNHVFIS